MDNILQIQKEVLSPSDLLLSLIMCSICGFILKHIYEKFSNYELSNKKISSILPILSLITFLIISIIKSSIALSLGLVGALSIVRFRAPIKEPEELLYLFLAIAIGIGFGSNQIYITILIFLFIVIFIFLYSRRQKNYDFNISIEWDEKINESNLLEKLYNFSKIKIQKLEINNSSYSVLAKISFKNINELIFEYNELKKTFKDCEITLYHEENSF